MPHVFSDLLIRLSRMIVLGSLVLAGCAETTTVDRTYGHRRGADGGRSLNGTGVLADLFVASGHQVKTRERLSASLDRAHVVVWIPNDFSGPSDRQRRFLESWLDAEDDRTIVYIGRDFDASVEYWKSIAKADAGRNTERVRQSLAVAKSRFSGERASLPESADFGWFSLERHDVSERVSDFSGPWSDGVSVSNSGIVLMSRLSPPDFNSERDSPVDADDSRGYWSVAPLLTVDGHAFAFQLERSYSPSGRIVVITNGSFVLNATLVNDEHRKLARRLVDLVGQRRRVVFLESGPGGPAIVDYESRTHHLLKYLSVWPLNYVFMHAMILGLIYCFSVFPVFGYARRILPASASDFGDHISALGRLCSQSGDAQFARARLKHFDENVQHDVTYSRQAPSD